MISLSILDKCSDQLLACKDDGEAMTVLGAYLEKVSNCDSTVPCVPHCATMSNYSSPDSEVSTPKHDTPNKADGMTDSSNEHTLCVFG